MSIFHLFDKKIILGPALDLIRQTSQKIKTIQAVPQESYIKPLSGQSTNYTKYSMTETECSRY